MVKKEDKIMTMLDDLICVSKDRFDDCCEDSDKIRWSNECQKLVTLRSQYIKDQNNRSDSRKLINDTTNEIVRTFGKIVAGTVIVAIYMSAEKSGKIIPNFVGRLI